ncbi:PfkB family carbohydrate kinase [Synechococcus sp. CS-1331]|uniref:PfkB family carbohydrate kinase n=1 Tax=Synechococcus sp. CS-1331 TaxID=2847973 RepID=UPI0037DA431E
MQTKRVNIGPAPVAMGFDSALEGLSLAVVGHVEWVSFLAVAELPGPGCICQAQAFREEPAGGGAVAAVQLARLSRLPVKFYTALGRDGIGEQAAARLLDLGLDLEVAWRDAPTRRGVSFVDPAGDRAITVIGQRLQPEASDPLPWADLALRDGVFVTATDAPGLQLCRQAGLLAVTPRLSMALVAASGVICDALIGSALDPAERVEPGELHQPPRLRIATEGAAGGWSEPGGRYPAQALPGLLVDSYGCGDSFAAGVTAGLAAGWSAAEAICLGSRCGAACATVFGPYAPS